MVATTFFRPSDEAASTAGAESSLRDALKSTEDTFRVCAQVTDNDLRQMTTAEQGSTARSGMRFGG